MKARLQWPFPAGYYGWENMCAEIDELRGQVIGLLSDLGRREEFIQRLMAELAQHGWGDFHYAKQPQDPDIVKLLEEGGYYDNPDTEAPSTDATPPVESDRGTGERQDSVGRGWYGEDSDCFGVSRPKGGPL